VTTTSEQVRAYKGPAIFSYGFRPFFLGGALWAAIAVALWLPVLTGHLTLPSAFTPVQWHVHELLYGYVPAIVAGFLLTATPNWTGRLPVTGPRLAFLFFLWVAGRVAVFCSHIIGLELAAIVDLAFLATFGLIILRELLAGETSQHLRVLVFVGLLFTGNATFHAEAILGYSQNYGTRIGIAAAVMLIMIIGGRIVPSFTRNWLAKQPPGRMPQPFGPIDAGVIGLSGIGLAGWIAAPSHRAIAILMLAAAVLNAFRLGRWAGERTAAEPLVAILHAGYAFVPVGFFLVALSIWDPAIVAASGALHGWTAGAVGIMTLAVMTRASLGHTGHPLTATRPIQLIYVTVIFAALARIVAAFGIERELVLQLSALAWVIAFAGFAIVYGPLLTKARA
jgi:uncharacterized protein involved in response to NO